MNDSKLIKQLMEHEGFKSKPYKCTEGFLTIGFGRNLDSNGITKQEAVYLLENDIDDCKADLWTIYGFRFFNNLPENVRLVQLDMRFNLGQAGYVGFKKMISAVRKMNFAEAVKQMKDSKWYKQVPNRAKSLIKMMEVWNG